MSKLSLFPRKVREGAIDYKERRVYRWDNDEEDCFNIFNLFSYLRTRKSVTDEGVSMILRRGNRAIVAACSCFRKGTMRKQSKKFREKLDNMPHRIFLSDSVIGTFIQPYLLSNSDGTIGVYVSGLQHAVALFIRCVNGVREFICFDPSYSMPGHTYVRSLVLLLDENCTLLRYVQDQKHGNVTGQCSMDACAALSRFLMKSWNPFNLDPEFDMVRENPKSKQTLFRHPVVIERLIELGHIKEKSTSLKRKATGENAMSVESNVVKKRKFTMSLPFAVAEGTIV